MDEAGDYEVEVTVRNQYTDGQLVTMDIVQGNTTAWYRADFKTQNDRQFWLEVEGNMKVTIVLSIQSATLESLEDDFIDTSITINAVSQTATDAASLELPVSLKRATSDDDAASGASSIDWVGIGIWVVGGALIVTLLLVLLMILNSEEEDDTPDWSEGGYEDNLTATYGAVAAAPNVGSMEKLIPEISPPAGAPPAVSPPAVQTGPPVPAEGLPEGWTMEQWNHYGQQWLDNNR